MKKTVFALLALMTTSLLSRAQDAPVAGSASSTPSSVNASATSNASSDEDTGQDVRFGIKLTGGIARVGGANFSSEAGNRASFGGGVMANILLTDESLSVQPELLYVVKGYKRNDNDEDLKLRYVTLPIMVRFKRQGFFVEGGPQISYLASASLKQGGASGTDTSRDSYNNVDWGLAGGLGYELANGLSLAARYNGSINSILPNQNNARVKAFSTLLELHLGFLLPQRGQ